MLYNICRVMLYNIGSCYVIIICDVLLYNIFTMSCHVMLYTTCYISYITYFMLNNMCRVML